MGEFSLSHIIFVLLVVLVIFGPSKLPGLGKGMGEAIRGFKKGLTDDKPDELEANRALRDAGTRETANQRYEANKTEPRRDPEIHT